jgi:hypothetical protein
MHDFNKSKDKISATVFDCCGKPKKVSLLKRVGAIIKNLFLRG